MRNRLAANICATIWFRKIFCNIFLKEKFGKVEAAGCRYGMTANGQPLALLGYLETSGGN